MYSIKHVLVSFFLLFLVVTLSAQSHLEFRISAGNTIDTKKALSGRLYVVVTPDLEKGYDIFYTTPVTSEVIFARDVKNWDARNGVITLNDKNAVGFPARMDSLPDGVYLIAAVLDVNPQERHFAYAPGNVYSRAKVDTIRNGHRTLNLVLTEPFQSLSHPDTESVKVVNLKSTLLSTFHHDSIRISAGVVLPPSYHTSTKNYPTVYILPEFDNDHTDAFILPESFTRYSEQEKIYVVVNPLCDYGNHVFANSATNGPRGDVLVKELIPYLEKKFRMVKGASGRYLTGHSSGGWAALWLQLSYPDFFNGAWATSPDPVDFRSFYKINLYDPKSNVFVDASGAPRTFDRLSALIGIDMELPYKLFSDYEVVIPKGEQLVSHEASFSPAVQRQPIAMWDRRSGKIDPRVVNHWKKYDIQYQLSANIKSLRKSLNGKLHIYCGDNDEYFLDYPVRLLETSVKQMGLDAEIMILPGKSHSDVLTEDIFERIDKGINQRLAGSH